MLGFWRFVADDHGAVTIEFTVLVPASIFLTVFFVDASIIYLSRTKMFNAARDIARKMSVGTLNSNDEVQEYAAQRLLLGSRTYRVEPNFRRADGDLTVTISVPVMDAAVVGFWFTPMIGRQLTVTARMHREPLLG